MVEFYSLFTINNLDTRLKVNRDYWESIEHTTHVYDHTSANNTASIYDDIGNIIVLKIV